MRRVEVAWLDSVSEGRWRSKEDVLREATREAMLHRSLGYVLRWKDAIAALRSKPRECEMQQTYARESQPVGPQTFPPPGFSASDSMPLLVEEDGAA